MFVLGCERCEGEALKYQQNFISALDYAIELINDTDRPQVEKEPVFKSVPTYRKYEDYHDADQYVRGWNDAMRYIFGIEEK